MSERRFNPENMVKLDSPERRKALPPEKILTLLAVEGKNDILDLGAGAEIEIGVIPASVIRCKVKPG